MSKRLDYISWNEYFMEIAKLSARRSKDPVTQVGACIVDINKRIVSCGYNGFPIGCSDDEFPWGKGDADPSNTKYPYVCHAEMNAICNSVHLDRVVGSTLYVTLFPCSDCAKLIIQTGIKHIYYLNEPKVSHGVSGQSAAKRMFDASGVEYKQFVIC